MLLKFVDENDPILKQVAVPFDFENPPTDPAALVADMIETMVEFKGVGLAAPQVGVPYRLFVMEINGVPQACFNPEVISISTDIEKGVEGCLSFPHLWLVVNRPVFVETRYTNLLGNLVNEKFENMEARCYLHETDHLNGVRFVDLVGPMSLKTAQGRRLKYLKKR